MKEVLNIITACLLISAVVGTEMLPPNNWTVENYPNPTTQPKLCGGGREDVMYVCDPNHILDHSQAKQLEVLIQEAMNTTTCPCASSVCDQLNPPGYRMGVALLKKMDIPPNTDNSIGSSFEHRLQSAGMFARTFLKRWNIGRCKEDLVILYSQDDRVLFVYTGDETKQKLDGEKAAEISQNAQHYFTRSGDKFMGLKQMISDYIAVFNGKYQGLEHKVVTPKYEAVVGSSTRITTFTLMTLTMTLLAALF